MLFLDSAWEVGTAHTGMRSGCLPTNLPGPDCSFQCSAGPADATLAARARQPTIYILFFLTSQNQRMRGRVKNVST